MSDPRPAREERHGKQTAVEEETKKKTKTGT
jgi:hypothetical protein